MFPFIKVLSAARLICKYKGFYEYAIQPIESDKGDVTFSKLSWERLVLDQNI